jgi:hypothetical protein
LIALSAAMGRLDRERGDQVGRDEPLALSHLRLQGYH